MNAMQFVDDPDQADRPELDLGLLDDDPRTERLSAAIDPPATAVKDTIAHMLASATVNAAFGQPIPHEQGVIVPAAEIMAVVGFGFGAGKMPTRSPDQLGNGTGGGGGGWVLTRPVSAIILTPHQIRQEVIIDVTKIALAAVSVVGVVAGVILRLRGTSQT